MESLKFNKGDECWIAIGNPDGKLSKGKVLEILDLAEHGYIFPNYLIEIETGIDPMLVIRCGLTMSDAEDKEIGLWRRGK